MLNSKKQESVYLYDKSQRELYLKELSLDKCPHEVQIYSLIDLEGGEKRLESGFWKEHLQSCKICQKKAQKVSESMREIELLIPTPELDQERLHGWRKGIENFVAGSPMDQGLSHKLKMTWETHISPAVFDFLTVLKKTKIQMLIWATFAWFFFSR